MGGIKGRLREIMEEQETIALERGQIALDYAVSLLKCSYLHIFDEM